MSGIILLATVFAVQAIGIFLAYAAVTGVLSAFARQTRPASLRNSVLVPSETHASGD
ncbi:MAG TPA: hypothetical protein VFA68_21735 [Terriglobales bacterium]|nr:hypothetical protein [Terriglobales bacterium]